MAIEFRAEVDKEQALVGIGNLHRAIVRKMVDIVDDAGDFAATNMKVRMPHATFRSAEQVHTDTSIKTGSFGHPEYQKIATAGDSLGSSVRYFAFGTGLYGPLHQKYGAKNASALLFKRHDGGNFTSLVKGQRAQRDWIHDSVRSTGNYVRARITSDLAALEFRR